MVSGENGGLEAFQQHEVERAQNRYLPARSSRCSLSFTRFSTRTDGASMPNPHRAVEDFSSAQARGRGGPEAPVLFAGTLPEVRWRPFTTPRRSLASYVPTLG